MCPRRSFLAVMHVKRVSPGPLYQHGLQRSYIRSEGTYLLHNRMGYAQKMNNGALTESYTDSLSSLEARGIEMAVHQFAAFCIGKIATNVPRQYYAST